MLDGNDSIRMLSLDYQLESELQEEEKGRWVKWGVLRSIFDCNSFKVPSALVEVAGYKAMAAFPLIWKLIAENVHCNRLLYSSS